MLSYPHTSRSLTGFTLIEVLVALVIVAVAIGTAVRIVGERTQALDTAHRHLLARWIAHNKAAEVTRAPLESYPNSGTDTQENLAFNWTRETHNHTTSHIVSIKIRVTDTDGHPYALYETWIPTYVQPTPKL